MSTYRWRYRPSQRSPQYARLALRRMLVPMAEWCGYTQDLIDDAELAVSELLTNAVRYGGGPVVVSVRITTFHLIIEVADTSPIEPNLGRKAAKYQENGRGMAIVRAISDNIGIEPRKRAPGKVTWAIFHLSRYIRRLGEDVRGTADTACG